MYVYLPWKKSFFPLRSHQFAAIEYDANGPFLRVLNASTNRLNKCRVYKEASTKSPTKSPTKAPAKSPAKSSIKSPASLESLVGGRVTGTVAQTGPAFFALLVDRIDGVAPETMGVDLVQMAKRFLRERHVAWNVRTPRSWSIDVTPTRQLGPHVSLHSLHSKDVGRQFTLTIVGVMHWEENSRWVALQLDGPLVDHTRWVLHLSCAQQPL